MPLKSTEHYSMNHNEKDTDSSKIQFNPLTLSFTGEHKYLEPSFARHYFERILKQFRICTLLAAFFYGAFGVLDTIITPEKYQYLWIIRWAIVCPCIILLYLFTYSKSARNYLQPVASLCTLIAGLGIIAMNQLIPPNEGYTYAGGLIHIIFFIFTFARLRFIWGTSVSCLIVVTFIVTTIIVGIAPKNYIIGQGFQLTLICILGMTAGYALEYQARRNFFLSLQLQAQKLRLAKSNRQLEDRVAQKTSELQQTNKLLKAENNERQMIEVALRDSQKRYISMVNNVTDIICVYDMNGKILETNHQMTTALGYTHDELYDLSYNDLIQPEERPAYYQYLTLIRHTGTAAGNITLITKTGGSRLFEYSNVLAEHTTGQQAIFSLARDITERKKAEKALADIQARFQNVFDTAAAGMAIIDGQEMTVLEINSAAAQMVGEDKSRIIGRHIDSLIHIPEKAKLSRLPMPTTHPEECWLKAKNQNLPILVSTGEAIFHEQIHWILSFIDISKIKEAEKTKRDFEIRSARAQHLESIGTLAGGIAHDFNNILYGIMGFAELALDDAKDKSIQANNLKEILKGGNRAKNMISQILTFGRQGRVNIRTVQPAPLIKEAVKLIEATLPPSATLKSHFAPNLKNILACPTHIHQVVMNLCTNAAHAIEEDGGVIEIRLTNTTINADIKTPNGTIIKGDYVRLIVKDNGEGISPELVDRIFEPFYTSKTQGKGSGMGLSVVLGIMQAHNGHIRVESSIREGSCFEVLLPAAQKSEEVAHEVESQAPTGTEHILVVDDEKSLLIMLDRMLSGLGYKVTICQSPEKALTLFNGQPNPFDLVISDLTMPKLNGKEFAAILLKQYANLPIILCTGYGEQVSEEELHAIGIRALLLKPILKKELAATIRKTLENKQEI